jgi:hypothetical protein
MDLWKPSIDNLVDLMHGEEPSKNQRDLTQQQALEMLGISFSE